MSWNYRVVIDYDGQLAIHEAFYDIEGRVEGVTVDPVFPRADSIEDLREELKRYTQALDESILEAKDVGLPISET